MWIRLESGDGHKSRLWIEPKTEEPTKSEMIDLIENGSNKSEAVFIFCHIME